MAGHDHSAGHEWHVHRIAVVATDASTNANANTDMSKSFTIIDMIAGDVTGDGVVNIGDALLLFNWVSFPNERGATYVLK